MPDTASPEPDDAKPSDPFNDLRALRMVLDPTWAAVHVINKAITKWTEERAELERFRRRDKRGDLAMKLADVIEEILIDNESHRHD